MTTLAEPVLIAIAAAIGAVALSFVNRLLAYWAFEQSYRRGFFTAGTLFGLYLGPFGLWFVQSWQTLDQPNLYNEMQLHQCPLDAPQRWHHGLALAQAGWALVYWQLIALALLRQSALAPVWLWPVALLLLAGGFLRFRGAGPPLLQLTLIEAEDAGEPEDLLRAIDLRQQWARTNQRALLIHWAALGCFAVAALALAGAVGLAVWSQGVLRWAGPTVLALVAAGAVFAALRLRSRAEDLAYECEQLEQRATPTPKHAELVQLQRRFVRAFGRLVVSNRWQRWLLMLPAVPFVLGVLFLIGTERGAFSIVIGGAILAWIVAAVIVALLNRRDEEVAAELEEIDGKGAALAAELEEEAVKLAQGREQQYLGEVYSFHDVGLVGEALEVPEPLRRRIDERKLLDDGQRRELSAERNRDETLQAEWHWAQFLEEQRITMTRDVTLTLGALTLAMALNAHLMGGTPEAVLLLLKTGGACGLYALLLHLAQRIPALRNPGCWQTAGIVFYIGVTVMIFRAMAFGLAAELRY